MEKYSAEQGLMPVVPNEATEDGCEAANRFFTECFLKGVQLEINFNDGLAVSKLLMACWKSAGEERTIEFEPGAFDDFIPAVARGGGVNPRGH